MHLADGQLAVGVCGPALLLGGWALAGGAAAVALYRLKEDRIPSVALLSAAFFLISFVAIPIPGGTVHLLLCGLIGLALGPSAVLAIGMALSLQAVFYGMGGFTTIGLNTVIMSFPAVGCYYLFGPMMRSEKKNRIILGAGLAGALGVVLCVLLYVGCLAAVGKDMVRLGYASALSHIPVIFVEAVLTPMIVLAIKRVKPEFF